MIKNYPITIDNIIQVEDILRLDLHAIKGKITKNIPLSTVEDYGKILQEIIVRYENIMLDSNMFFVNRLDFLDIVLHLTKGYSVELLDK